MFYGIFLKKKLIKNCLCMNKFKIRPSNVFLIEIIKPIAYMPIDKYQQWASYNNGRFYISRGPRGYISVSEKSVKVLAQRIVY